MSTETLITGYFYDYDCKMIQVDLDPENYLQFSFEPFNSCTLVLSGEDYECYNIPNLSLLSEEEYFQMSVVWEFNFSIDLIRSIQAASQKTFKHTMSPLFSRAEVKMIKVDYEY